MTPTVQRIGLIVCLALEFAVLAVLVSLLVVQVRWLLSERRGRR